MPQYDVYELGRRASGKSFIVVLQHDGMYDLGTTFVAPLVPSNYFKHPFPVINPVVTIDEKDYIIRMEQMAAIAAKLFARLGFAPCSKHALTLHINFSKPSQNLHKFVPVRGL